jgi:hypothetical protein
MPECELAETKDHADWELISKCAEKSSGKQASVLKEAADELPATPVALWSSLSRAVASARGVLCRG